MAFLQILRERATFADRRDRPQGWPRLRVSIVIPSSRHKKPVPTLVLGFTCALLEKLGWPKPMTRDELKEKNTANARYGIGFGYGEDWGFLMVKHLQGASARRAGWTMGLRGGLPKGAVVEEWRRDGQLQVALARCGPWEDPSKILTARRRVASIDADFSIQTYKEKSVLVEIPVPILNQLYLVDITTGETSPPEVSGLTREANNEPVSRTDLQAS